MIDDIKLQPPPSRFHHPEPLLPFPLMPPIRHISTHVAPVLSNTRCQELDIARVRAGCALKEGANGMVAEDLVRWVRARDHLVVGVPAVGGDSVDVGG